MGLYPKNLNEYVASMGIPRGPLSKVYLVDPVNGSDSNSGTNWGAPLKTLTAAEDLCVADRHDVVLFLAGDTADNPAAAIAWDKDYTHLIGVGCELPGVGQRCRVVGTSALDLSQVITVSANGCIFKNIQFYNGNDAAADSGAAIVSGGRNLFENCFFAGMAHATPGARAGCYSLNVSGEENVFKRCSIGLQTIIRAQANTELLISGTACYRNKFIQCELLSWSVTAGKLLVKFAAASVPWTTQFEDCLFNNLDMSAGGADGASIDNAFGDSSSAKHQVILRGKNQFVGCTGVADTLTNIWSAEPVPATGFGISVNPAA